MTCRAFNTGRQIAWTVRAIWTYFTCKIGRLTGITCRTIVTGGLIGLVLIFSKSAGLRFRQLIWWARMTYRTECAWSWPSSAVRSFWTWNWADFVLATKERSLWWLIWSFIVSRILKFVINYTNYRIYLPNSFTWKYALSSQKEPVQRNTLYPSGTFDNCKTSHNRVQDGYIPNIQTSKLLLGILLCPKINVQKNIHRSSKIIALYIQIFNFSCTYCM